MTSFTRRLATAAACAALALPVLAQNAPAVPDKAPSSATTAPSASQSAERQAKRQQWQEKRAARHAERLGKLKQQLALTPAQEPAWTRFAQAMQRPGNAARPQREDLAKLTTPQRIDRLRELRAERNAAMDARLDATKAFYAELQPEQQRSFDSASMRMLRGAERHAKHPMHGHRDHGRHAAGGQPAA